MRLRERQRAERRPSGSALSTPKRQGLKPYRPKQSSLTLPEGRGAGALPHATEVGAREGSRHAQTHDEWAWRGAEEVRNDVTEAPPRPRRGRGSAEARGRAEARRRERAKRGSREGEEVGALTVRAGAGPRRGEIGASRGSAEARTDPSRGEPRPSRGRKEKVLREMADAPLSGEGERLPEAGEETETEPRLETPSREGKGDLGGPKRGGEVASSRLERWCRHEEGRVVEGRKSYPRRPAGWLDEEWSRACTGRSSVGQLSKERRKSEEPGQCAKPTVRI
eukprot:1382617-Rhodomonas_salina.1